MFTEKNNKLLIDTIVDFWNIYQKVIREEGQTSNEEFEIRDAVHRIQGTIALREVSRLKSPIMGIRIEEN